MTDESSIPVRVALDVEGRVAGDLPCIQCQYNLRTLHREAKCPECGNAVIQSLEVNWLCYTDPEWLMKIARGLRQIVRMIGFTLAWIILMIILAPIVMLISPSMLWPPIAAAVLSLGASCFVGVNLVEGVWRFTTPEPIGANRGPASGIRRFIRAFTVLTTIALAVALTSLWVHHRSPIPVAAGLCSLICFLICHIASLLYLRKLALRMSCRSEPSYALGLAMAVAGALVLTLLEGASLLGNRSSNLDYHAFIAVVCLSVMLVLAFAIIANRLYVMLDAAARSIPTTDRPGFAAELAGRTLLIWGNSR